MNQPDIEKTAFPKLDVEQMASVAEIGELMQFGPEEKLIDQGCKDYPFYVLKSGTVRIVEQGPDQDRMITTHGAASFTGDVDMLTGRSAVISAIANDAVEAYRMDAQRLRLLLNQCPAISELFLEAFQMRRRLLQGAEFTGVSLIGITNTRAVGQLREFFYKNHVPHTFHDASTDEAQQRLQELGAETMELPVVHCNGVTISRPVLSKIAECIGISKNVDGQAFDLAIVGSGPAGLAAAVYASSEGIKTLVIDSVGPGGQAASSSKIENFMGFPSGISGSDLANRGYLQALKFGATFIAPISVRSIHRSATGEFELRLDSEQTVQARSVLVSTGVSYRQLDLPGYQKFEGAGVYYAATSVEARVCSESTAVVVGGGNSAGQAAMFLANTAREVKLLIRGGDLSRSMSAYLCDRITQHPRIEVMKYSEVEGLRGSEFLQSIQIRNNQTGEVSDVECRGLFIFIGAKPHTDWLPNEVCLDEKGFIVTGAEIEDTHGWTLDRAPCALETTVPGILAAGDVRSGTTKRCGFAVGDGSLAIACVHRILSGLA